ncbi:MAG TPA: glutamate 5-kinase [Spirochaetota bacterium]|nr:glutamate 5-kinase [Spirochaetota bacterium]
MERRSALKPVKRIVVKIGSSSLSCGDHMSRDRMAQFVRDVAALVRKGYQLVIVTSGAISAGAARMKMKRHSVTIPEKQALAAVGQTILMDEYRRLFLEESIDIGQVLLTGEDVSDRRRFLNARNAMTAMMRMNVIPIVNENDTVAVDEIKLGDNDTLAAYVAQIVEADLTILLSDIDGFYRSLSDPAPLHFVPLITDEIRNAAGGSGSVHGTGGMFTKVRAAEMIMMSGDMMIIAKAGEEHVLGRIVDGEEIGTLFYGGERTLDGRKRWIAFNMDVSGTLVIDDGAAEALIAGKKSLLPAGIISAEGEYAQGDAVSIVNKKGKEIGRGISNYSSDEISRIKGMKTSEVRKMFETFYDEVVHRDNMIVY